jgi:predicted N-acetyltransferase YhbS
VTLVLRPAQVADIFRMQEIERDAAELFRGSPLIDITNMAVVAMSDHIGSIEAQLSIIAEVDGRVAGFVMGEMQGADAYLHELDVSTAYQRRGAGAALVRAFVDAARAKGAAVVYLSTFRDPPWNAPFYARMGFRGIQRADYLPWMAAIETEQAKILDIATRVFMQIET